MARPLISSFKDAFRGVFHVYGTQRNVRIHSVVALAVVAAGLWLGLGPVDWAIVAVTISLVLMAEMMNSALETLADAVYPDHHPLIGMAKDMAAGAVLVSAFGAVIVGLLLLGPRLLRFL